MIPTYRPAPPIPNRHLQKGSPLTMSSTVPDPRTAGPTQIPPRPPIPPTPADACVNFNLIDSRVVCLAVPQPLAEADVAFILAIVQAHVTAVARRGH